MKKLFTPLILICSLNIYAQKYALIDRSAYYPIKYSDIINDDDLKKGYFPIYHNEIDSLKDFVGDFLKIKRNGVNRKTFDEKKYKTNNIKFKITNERLAYGDRYDVEIISTTEQGTNTLKLSNSGTDLNNNERYIRKLFLYLKKKSKYINNNNY